MNTESISIPKEMLDKLIIYLHSVGDDGAMSWVDIIETYVEMWEHFHNDEQNVIFWKLNPVLDTDPKGFSIYGWYNIS